MAGKVFITGIDSFTGFHLAAALKDAGYDVCGTSRRAGDAARGVHLCDISDRDAVAAAVAAEKPDYAVHLAGISHPRHENIGDYYSVNTLGTEWLLSALARQAGSVRKVIVASSAAVYGSRKEDVLDETLTPNPVSHYGISKLAAENVARRYLDALPVVIARPFNYTGPGQPGHFVVPKIVKHFRRGDKVIELGNIDVVREFNDVEFACRAYIGLLPGGGAGETVNLCTGRGIALSQVVTALERISGHSVELRSNPAYVRANEKKTLVGSPCKLNAMIDGLPDIPFEQTLRSMLG